MSLLSRQLAAFRREHKIPEVAKKKGEVAPSILFSPKEARTYDADSFAALAIRGIKEAATLDPDIAASEPLFTGPWRDRDTLTKKENERIDQDLRKLLLLLSPHLLTQAAQEVVEGLLQRYQVHHYNVEDLLACALPYHDSPFFTRLVQGVQMEGNPRWGWLQKIKEKPATLVRSALAKHASKNLVVLTLIGQHMQDVLQLQKAHRVLATFFVAIWLSTLAAMPSMSSDVVEAAVPALIAMLRRPHLRDSFHAAIAVLAALCVKADLDPALQLQLLKRVTKQLGGERARPAAELLVFLQQLQVAPAVTEHLAKAAASLGPQEVLASLPKGLDCSNCLAGMVERGMFLAMTAKESEEQQELAMGLLNNAVVVDLFPGPLALAAFQAVGKACSQPGGLEKEAELASELLQGCVATLGQRQPAALGAACRQAVAALSQRGHDSKALLQLLSPAGGAVAVDVVQEAEVLPLIEAFAHTAVEVRVAAVKQAAAHLAGLADKEADATAPQQKIYVGLLMEAVDDRSVEVAEEVLKLDGLWSSSPQVTPGMAARVLISALEALCGWNSWGSRAGLCEMFVPVLLEEPRPCRLVPLLIQCVAQVYGRADCEVELRARIDAAMLPLLIFCIVAMDLTVAAEAGKDEAEAKAAARVRLRGAVLDFASASQQPLLKGLKGKKPGGTKELSKAVAKAVDLESAVALCNLVQGKSWPAGGSDAKALTDGPLAGAGAQAAAAALLGAALLRVAQELASAPASAAQAEGLLVGAAEAWEKMALHQSIMHSANGGENRYLDQSRQLLQAVLACISHLAEAGVLTYGKGEFAAALRGLLRRVLEQAQTFGPELRGAVVGQEALVRPALLRVALTEERVTAHPQAAARAAAASANALLLLRSLITRGKASAWAPDQSLLLALVGRLAGAGASEVRRAALATIQVLQEDPLGSPLEPYGAAEEGRRWGSPCALALREAGVLREAEEVMTPGAWKACAAQELVLTGMPPKALALLLETLLEHRAEIIQDPASVAAAMGHFFRALGKSLRPKASAFWSLGACALGLDPAAVSILGAVPAAGVLTALSEPLRLCAKDAVAALRDRQAKAGAPTLLRAGALALQAVPQRSEDAQTKQQARAAAASEEALASFARGVALPLCSCLSELWEGPSAGDAALAAPWQEQASEPGAVLLVECFQALCSGLTSFIRLHASEELKVEAIAELFRLCVAAQLPSPIEAAGGGGEEGAAPTSTAQVIAALANRELDLLRLDAESLHQLVSRAPALERARLASEPGRIAAEVLGRQVAALSSAGLAGAGSLLTKLGSMAKDVAAQQSKAAVAPPEEATMPGSSTLLHLLSAVAALCEHVGAAAGVAAGAAAEDIARAVPQACSFVAEGCRALRQRISASMLAAVVRACGALALLVPATEPVPAPLQTCVEALRCYARPLTPDVLILLQGGLKGLWLGAGRPAEGRTPQEDMLAQGRLRLLLHTIAGDGVLLQELDRQSCLGLARSAGLWASLDFVLLLFLRRRRAQPSAEKKRRGRKRRGAAAREEAFEEELLGAAALAPSAEETAVEEAMALLLAVPPDCRYHCFGTFLQTLCALASELVRAHEAKLSELPWGQGLLPMACRADIFAVEAAGSNQAPAALLDLGLSLAGRFLTEHGLPGELDAAAEVPFNAFRTTAMPEPVTVCSISYAAWASCLVTVLLERRSVAEAEGLAPCGKRASELFGMFVRSLAVNHLVTFFRVAGLVLQIPEHSPTASKGDLLAKPAFANAAAACFLRVAGEALQVRQELEATMEEEVLAQCSPLCTATTRYVSQRFLGGATSVVVAWRFLDGLCLFFGGRDPQPVLELCLPAAAAALGEYAAEEEAGPPQASEAAISCCSYIQTSVKQLGRGILEQLNVLTPPLLELVRKTQAAAEKSPAATVGEKALLTLQVLVKSVGAFLSPFLDRLLGSLLVASPAGRTQILEELGKDLVEAVPQRLLLAAVKIAVETAGQRLAAVEGPAADAVGGPLLAAQRLAVMQIWIFSRARPEAVAEAVDSILQMMLQLLAAGPAAATALLRAGCQLEELPGKLLRQRDSRPAEEVRLVAEGAGWWETCSEGNILRLQVQSAAAFTQFALRLELDVLKPRFMHLLSWARHGEEQLLSRLKPRKAATADEADTEDACRALALAAVMRGLVAEAPAIAEEMLLPLTSQDLGSALQASRSCALRLAALHRSRQTPKKRQRGKPEQPEALTLVPGLASRVLQDFSWWWFDVARLTLVASCEMLAPLRTATSQSPAAKAASEALLDPCAALLDIFEFLLPSDESPLAQALLQALQGAFVELAAIADGGAGVKTLFTTLLRKSASDDPEVRLCTVRCCHKVWTELGVQVVTGLTEVVTFSSELLEDEDGRVEEAVRAMIRTVEECTGESLQESLKR